MNSCFVIDSHCDTIGIIADKGIKVFRDKKCHVSLEGLRHGRVGLQFFAAFVGPKKQYPCLQRGLKLIEAFYTMLDAYPDDFHAVLKPDDINIAEKQGKIGAMLTVEGGDILEGELLNLRILYRLGVRAMTLTWNHRNEIADGALENRSRGGLSVFGREVVREMNQLGMIVDVSHLSEEGFYDVIEISEKPITATHSNAWTVCHHPRNLKDEQIKSLAAKRGVMGINFYPPFLSKGQAGMKEIIEHIEYIAGLAGTDVIGLGSDFDGIEETPVDVKGPQDYEKILNALLQLNYGEDDVRKIAFGNYKRLLNEVLKY